ncbi:T9SS type A sorting domain-containing protein [Winogradskyella sp. SM1960]|uniref:T9SS type A sorting domain-containing protein n=1 Tax=Winogradskyella sp. SM1960 TaxID=2865955 RepID=UPI001CD2CE8C|nr:T9SS type A sorting domain-containing protein [Winogradskyella sp. SM1960]
MKTKLFFLLLITSFFSFAQIPTTNLVAKYDFDNGALTDAINNVSLTKTGTASTTITDRNGIANAAISLNGDDLSRPDIEFDINNGTNPYLPKTISFWLKTTTNDSSQRIIYHDNDQSSLTDSDYLGVKIYLENGQVNAVNRAGSNGNVFTHPANIADNQWHHVVVQAFSTYTTPIDSYAATRFITYIYVDNVKIGSSGYNRNGPNVAVLNKHVGDIVFSRLRDTSIASNDKYEDGIDEVLIYTHLLTDSEVSLLGGFTGTLYVDANATGTNTGASWANAFTNLQDALNSSSEGNIWVAKGVYKPSATDTDASFMVDTSIYGGFAGNEVYFLDRDMSLIHTTNATILSGDLSGNDPTTSVGYNDATRSDNSKHVVEVSSNDIEINGFTIQDGHADAITGDDRFGAGIFKPLSVTSLSIKNCTIKNNVALSGAGLSLSCNDTSNMIIDACVFEGNLANTGAGLDYHMSSTNKDMTISITNSVFNNNRTDDDAVKNRKGQGASAARLRAYFSGVTLNATIANNTFVNNSSLGDSGSSIAGNFPVVGISYYGGGFGNITVANNIFWDNITHSNQVAIAIGRMHNAYTALQSTNSQRLVENNTDEDGFSTFTGTTNTSSSNPNLNSNFQLSTGSSAIDTGNNTYVNTATDLLGNQRIFNTTVDRGAYEYDPSLGINDLIVNENEIKLYPNPTTSILNIKMTQNLKQVSIYSVLGSEVLRTQNETIDVSGLSNEIFLIKIEDENGNVSTKRFVKK